MEPPASIFPSLPFVMVETAVLPKPQFLSTKPHVVHTRIPKYLTFTAVRIWPLIFVAHFLVPLLFSTFPSLVHTLQVIVLSEAYTCFFLGRSTSDPKHCTANGCEMRYLQFGELTWNNGSRRIYEACGWKPTKEGIFFFGTMSRPSVGPTLIQWVRNVKERLSQGLQLPNMKLITLQKQVKVRSGLPCQSFMFSCVFVRTVRCRCLDVFDYTNTH